MGPVTTQERTDAPDLCQTYKRHKSCRVVYLHGPSFYLSKLAGRSSSGFEGSGIGVETELVTSRTPQ